MTTPPSGTGHTSACAAHNGHLANSCSALHSRCVKLRSCIDMMRRSEPQHRPTHVCRASMLRSARQIINNEADANWYQAEKNGQTGFIPANYVEMAPHEYAARIHAPMRIRTLMQSHMQACKHTHTHTHTSPTQHSCNTLSLRPPDGSMDRSSE